MWLRFYHVRSASLRRGRRTLGKNHFPELIVTRVEAFQALRGRAHLADDTVHVWVWPGLYWGLLGALLHESVHLAGEPTHDAGFRTLLREVAGEVFKVSLDGRGDLTRELVEKLARFTDEQWRAIGL